MMWIANTLFWVQALGVVGTSTAFHQCSNGGMVPLRQLSLARPWRRVRTIREAGEDNSDTGSGSITAEQQGMSRGEEVGSFISEQYPEFFSLLQKNEDVWGEFKKSAADTPYTFFAPNPAAFDELGTKKQLQLEDPRNVETAEKMAAYHVIAGAAVSDIQLRMEDWTTKRPKDGSPPKLKVGGVVTQGGEVPVGRGKQGGGFMGLGGKEDMTITIGPTARLVRSMKMRDCIIHEVDALVSPEVLWRYCDQLRIPGF